MTLSVPKGILMMKLIFASLLLTMTLPAHAANLKGTLEREVQGTNQPVFDQSVVLEKKVNSDYVAVSWCYTNPQGAFFFSNIEAGTYRLHAKNTVYLLPPVGEKESIQDLGKFSIQD